MLKEKQSVCGRLRSYVIEFGPDTFSTVGNNLFCKVCEIRISSEKKFNVSQHVSTDKLLKDTKTKNRKKKQILLTSLPTKSTFNTRTYIGVFERYISKSKDTSMRFIFSYLVLELMFEPIRSVLEK